MIGYVVCLCEKVYGKAVGGNIGTVALVNFMTGAVTVPLKSPSI